MSAPTADRSKTGVFSATRARIPQKTLRTDNWRKAPILTDLGLAVFVIYATVRAFMQRDYYVAEYGYLTPFYSPCLVKWNEATQSGCVPEASHFGQFLPDVWWLPYAAVSLPFLLLFRLTCYYYRRAYYRSVWQSPTACAVAEPHAKYSGETKFPLILQNSHRYFFYIAVLISLINTYDAIIAFAKPGGGFGFGLGNVILVVNVTLLWVYTLSCHSCRHVTGGRLKHFSKHPVRYWIWTQVSKINTRHMLYAWITLGTLMLTDFYIMLVASGTISDLRFIG
ncbi:hypothetical protein [Mycobacterium sp. ACS4331]|uniref:hypothetical protein n=1 Tax=Mycobacterium sp. ACS4331 TaxID=1834121 RepID=UPI0007FE21B1|nr:hypothetical protein [Mycobacterium sp. ACS4331]OBF29205.1 hypothetical protein A5727_24540 [Mycobacterium sp. ACS4331]